MDFLFQISDAMADGTEDPTFKLVLDMLNRVKHFDSSLFFHGVIQYYLTAHCMI